MRTYIVDFEPGPSWRPGGTVFDQDTDDHVAYVGALWRRGTVVAAGPLGDGSGGRTILHAVDAAEARRVAEDDPAVRRGLLRARVREWAPLAWSEDGEAIGYLRPPFAVVGGGPPHPARP